MKKMRKILSLALAVIMMMAMSITAFADEATGTTFTVTGLAQEEETVLKLYELATPANGDWDFADWADRLFTKNDTTKEYEVKSGKTWNDVASAALNSTATPKTYTTQKGTDNKYEQSHTFDGLTGAAYVLIAQGTDYTYAVMCAKTHEYVNGAYTLKAANVVAKATNVPVKKTADKGFVAVGETVTFTITTAVPNNADVKTFVIYDKPVNLNDLALTKVTLAGVEKTGFTLADPVDGVYSVDLTSLLADANVGKTVILTVTGVVGSDIQFDDLTDAAGYAYKNTAWSNLADPKTDPNVIGYTGGALLTKKSADGNNDILKGAKFQVLDSTGTALKFTKVETGVYKLDANGTDKVEATEGTVKVEGLKAGTYAFHETDAPTGYSINTTDVTFTITASTTANVYVNDKVMLDTKLASLPFTGGMGTTIFTVLGVAIMAIAAALFFASKKKASK